VKATNPLPGEISPCARKGDAEGRSEKSAEAVVAAAKLGRDGDPPTGSREGSTARRAERVGGQTPVSLEDAMRQKTRQLVLPLECRGEAPAGQRSGEASTAASGNEGPGTDRLMEEVVQRGNAKAALKRVRQNKGSPGVDGMTVDELPEYLAEHWEAIREELLAGAYQPKPVKRQEIPKSGGGVRELGIPTALDRFVQQAILQVLQPRFDPTFSEHSHGFRPGRRAHDAVCEAQRYIQEGRRVVVDVDLEKFFDRVNHDVLMGKLSARIADKRMLGLIRRYLEAGIMANGVVVERSEGTPQGGPLSPLLANVLLDEVDKELEKRGHAFVRYADDCNVYVRSRRAGEDVMKTLRRLYGRLRLRVNEVKSAVARPQDRKFLGYSFWYAKGGEVRRRVAPKALEAMKERVRAITARNGGRSIPVMVAELRSYLVGWRQYFQLADTPSTFHGIDKWIRHRLRQAQLKQWKRGTTVYRELRARQVPERAASGAAAHARRWWRTAAHPALSVALPMSYYDGLGVPRLAG
jgi:RNA-directed DNA polymerase